jgi:DNA polymerase
MTTLGLDFETRSAVDLKRAGAHRYATDPSTDVWCACYSLDDDPVKVWRPGDPCPPEIALAQIEGWTIAGWNVAFERLIWAGVCTPRYGWPTPALKQFDDTAAAAAAMGLPRNLGDAARALGSEHEKDDSGHRLMLQMAKPRRPRKGEATDKLLWWDDEERISKLIAYCGEDVAAEREMRRLLIPLPAAERETYLFDQRMNDRGVKLDMALVRAMRRVTEQAKEDLDARMSEATGGAVTACTQVARIVAFIDGHGENIPSLAKAALSEALDDPFMPDDVRTVLELRQSAAKSSTAKLDSMRDCVSRDGRARGLHLYHGASTGRWSGRLIQPQNFPRGTGTVDDPEAAAPDFLTGSAPWVALSYGDPMSAVSDMLRACMVASDRHRLLAADFANIEGRVTSWLAGEDWKLDAFRAADEGRGPGLYELTASGIFNCAVEGVTKAQRQVGKTAELALGFAGGVPAFHAFAKIYRTDMAQAYDSLKASVDGETWEKAERAHIRWSKEGILATDVMSREAWIASDVTKRMWREKHPATTDWWNQLDAAVFFAVVHPGEIVHCGRLSYVVRNGFLWCRLPSGRCLAYGSPDVRQVATPWGEKMATPTALGVDSVTKRWRRFPLTRQILSENPVQAVARDCMRDGMLRCERAGYPIVLTVHDEAVADTPNDFGSLAEFERLLSDMPAWAEGLPVVATGFEAQRYRK